jgi:hypothetical protein
MAEKFSCVYHCISEMFFKIKTKINQLPYFLTPGNKGLDGTFICTASRKLRTTEMSRVACKT